jgi:hypothetical protein
MSRRLFCRFCHARSRVPIVLGPFHDCAFCERAAPDAPETIDDQRRGTGCRYRTIYGGSRGSASLPARRSGSVLSLLLRPMYDQTYQTRSPISVPYASCFDALQNHREWLENCGADLDRKLQNAMKSSERCLFLAIPFVEVLEGLLARRQRKD